ncbi:hypothetical protein FJTKL_01914 [Diaporthe vaccinii]|uniref:Uncharacterized protein n=1 Tax=Diaporthe vaccinii TaxID=105482 RepID=A0ABR4F4S0_9PEZI
MSNNKHETETTSGHSKEAVASQTAPETTSGHEEKAKSGSNKKTRGSAVIPPKMSNLRTGAPFDWDE